MVENRPLLSICIPTYNRCAVLKDVLERYVDNPAFDDDVELVISDNASTDATEEICTRFCEGRSNIHYYRNPENISDANFVRVLDLGQGQYLKLFNDWVYCSEEELQYMKDCLRDNLEVRRPVFFTGDTIFTRYKAEFIDCKNLDEYVKVVSTFVTYNNIFGCWRDQWVEVADKQKHASLKLQQVDWTYQIVSKGAGCLLYDKSTFTTCSTPLGKRDGYNWFQIHLDNYYRIMAPYVERGEISQKTLRKDKHNLLRHFKRELGLALFGNYSQEWRFDTKGTAALLWKYYKFDPYFYYYICVILLRYIVYRLREKS